MKHALTLALAILLLAATGWGETIQTNIQATVTAIVTTNTYAPTQYWHQSNIMWCNNTVVTSMDSYTQGSNGSWENRTPYQWGGFNTEPKTRLNPDVRITEVHEVKTVSFKCDGIPVKVMLYDKILSTVTEDRVETTETTTKDGCKVTTIVEQWKRRGK